MVRPATGDHLWFVVNSWIRSYRNGCEWAAKIPGVVYFSDYGHRGLIVKTLARTNVETLIVGPEDDASFIHGWICYEPGPTPLLHYLYVKDYYRGKGLARMLTRAAGLERGDVVCSHETRASESWKRAGRQIDYRNPYLERL